MKKTSMDGGEKAVKGIVEEDAMPVDPGIVGKREVGEGAGEIGRKEIKILKKMMTQRISKSQRKGVGDPNVIFLHRVLSVR